MGRLEYWRICLLTMACCVASSIACCVAYNIACCVASSIACCMAYSIACCVASSIVWCVAYSMAVCWQVDGLRCPYAVGAVEAMDELGAILVAVQLQEVSFPKAAQSVEANVQSFGTCHSNDRWRHRMICTTILMKQYIQHYDRHNHPAALMKKCHTHDGYSR